VRFAASVKRPVDFRHILLLAWADFTQARNDGRRNCSGVRHLRSLRRSKTAAANTVMSRRQSDHTSAFVAPVRLLWGDVTHAGKDH
jgi:hypothetical protein